MSDLCFQFKGSAITAMVLEIYQIGSESFAEQLQHKVGKAPGLFQQSPIVISLEKLSQECSAAELQQIVDLCRQEGLKPMAFKGPGHFEPLVADTGLPLVPVTASRAPSSQERARTPQESPSIAEQSKGPAPERQPEVDQTNQRAAAESRPKAADSATASAPATSASGKIVKRPVRSGQQIYAEGDLIILAQVSEGAEVLATGNIHVYGPLRGRALAGIKGDQNASIFCQSLEAELVSIAGNFKLSDALQGERWRSPAQIVLDDERLNIKAL